MNLVLAGRLNASLLFAVTAGVGIAEEVCERARPKASSVVTEERMMVRPWGCSA